MTPDQQMPAFDITPCPFCGGEAKRLDFETVGTELGGDPNAGGSCITCERCGASSPVLFDRKENLYSSWNERHQQSRAGGGERERLAQWCDGEAQHWDTGDSGHAIARDRYRAIAAALRAPPAQSAAGWRDISTAPKDGTVFLVSGGVAHWHDGELKSVTAAEYPGRKIQWDCRWWQPLLFAPDATPPAGGGGA